MKFNCPVLLPLAIIGTILTTVNISCQKSDLVIPTEKTANPIPNNDVFSNIKQPPPLKRGDKVVMLCPAGYFSKPIEDAIRIFKEWGLEVILGQTVRAKHFRFAGDDGLRTEDLQYYLDDNSVKAIFCVRGGYGTLRIIDNLNFEKFKGSPKWIVGFSDITVLLNHVYANYKIQTIHGPMPATITSATPGSIESLRNILFNEPIIYEYPNSVAANRNGEGVGSLIGGNLTTLNNLLGSSSEPNFKNTILVIEDVGELLYHIDRMLLNLKRAGKLEYLQGLIVGDFTVKPDVNPFGKTLEEIIMEKVKDYNYPVCFNFPVGYIDNNQAFIFGRQAHLKVTSEKISLVYKSNTPSNFNF